MPARDYLWELPAGKIDPGESALQAAKRELKEETGFKASQWTKLVTFFPSPGFLAEQVTIYLATGLKDGKSDPQGDERINHQWFTVRELEKMILAGEIIDAKTIVGLYTRKLRK
jgi:ADP-ribose pyrophosphatase